MPNQTDDLLAEIRAGFARHSYVVAELHQTLRLVLEGLDTLNERIGALERRIQGEVIEAVDSVGDEMRELVLELRGELPDLGEEEEGEGEEEEGGTGDK